jgi:hypothetical protein
MMTQMLQIAILLHHFQTIKFWHMSNPSTPKSKKGSDLNFDEFNTGNSLPKTGNHFFLDVGASFATAGLPACKLFQQCFFF